jgi:hypothetical protein
LGVKKIEEIKSLQLFVGTTGTNGTELVATISDSTYLLTDAIMTHYASGMEDQIEAVKLIRGREVLYRRHMIGIRGCATGYPSL